MGLKVLMVKMERSAALFCWWFMQHNADVAADGDDGQDVLRSGLRPAVLAAALLPMSVTTTQWILPTRFAAHGVSGCSLIPDYAAMTQQYNGCKATVCNSYKISLHSTHHDYGSTFSL